MKNPKIFVFKKTPHGPGATYQALAEDGTPLGTHISSSPEYAMNDLQGHSDDFDAHYPEGWELEYLEDCSEKFHEALRANVSKYGKLNFDYPNNARIEVVWEDDDGKEHTTVIE